MMEFQSLFVLACNISGAVNRKAKAQVKELVRKHKHTICFIFEPHVQFEMVEGFWRSLGFSRVAVEEVQGHPVVCGFWHRFHHSRIL